MILKSFIMSKLIYRYKPLLLKNKKSLLDVDLLLLAINFAITNFYD